MDLDTLQQFGYTLSIINCLLMRMGSTRFYVIDRRMEAFCGESIGPQRILSSPSGRSRRSTICKSATHLAGGGAAWLVFANLLALALDRARPVPRVSGLAESARRWGVDDPTLPPLRAGCQQHFLG